MAGFRELSARVEIDVHKRPNKLRRRTWWASLWLSLLCLAWLWYEGVRGEYQIFEGGALSTPHTMFQNDCAKCHTTWGPIDRIIAMDATDNVYTVTNDACLSCHPGSIHNEQATRGLSCAQCHIEHIGDHDLKRVSDQKCVDCHGELETHDGKYNFDKQITGFATKTGAKHPEFAFVRMLDGESDDIGSAHRVRKLVGEIERQEKTGEIVTVQGDLASIRFNHKKHIQQSADGTWFVNDGLRDGVLLAPSVIRSIRYRSATQTCIECHDLDDNGAYIKPIVYENHCQKCHALLFDNDFDRFPADGWLLPAKRVPHSTPDIVRGYLTNTYAQQAIKRNAASRANSTIRLIPGQRLTRETEAGVERLVSTEVHRLRAERILFGRFRSGCKYCHEMARDSTPIGQQTDGDPAHDMLQVVPPRIPKRWLPHSRFSHEAHLLLNCVDCHKVVDSTETSDVLLPEIGLCRKCHSSKPHYENDSGIPLRQGARNDCAECHDYHSHDKKYFEEWLDRTIPKSRPDLTENLRTKSSR